MGPRSHCTLGKSICGRSVAVFIDVDLVCESPCWCGGGTVVGG